MTNFLEMLAEAKKTLSPNACRYTEVVRQIDGQEVTLSALIADGNVKPGSFRQTWYVDTDKISKDEAKRRFN